MNIATERLFESKTYIIENLDCANCAAIMEEKIKGLEGVESASITFATKQLRLSARDIDGLLPRVRELCAVIEPEVEIVECSTQSSRLETRVYKMENLDCANCAAKIEEIISAFPEVAECSVAFASGQMRLTAQNHDSLLEKVREAVSSLEPGVRVFPKEAPTPSSGKPKIDENKRLLMYILFGAGLFILGEVFERVLPAMPPIFYISAYLILGGGILLKAGRNLIKGQIFDENFLMSVATLGAFATGQLAEAVGVMLFFRAGEYFEHKAVEKSRSQIMEAVDMRPETVNLETSGGLSVIPAAEAVPGDILLVRPGDRIPLDGVVTEGESRIDTSPVTGEPVPVKVSPGISVLSGCVNTSGVLRMKVEKVLGDSMVTRILDSVENAAAGKPKIDRFITRFARVYTPAVLTFSALIAVVPPLFSGDWHYWIYTALTFLVISCPCALVLSVPLAFFAGIGAGSKRGILFKSGSTLEAMNRIKAVALDKTGTITKGSFEVISVSPEEGISESALLALAASCEVFSTHPIAASIVSAAAEKGLELEHPSDASELAGLGISAMVSGEKVLCGSMELMRINNIAVPESAMSKAGTQVMLAKNGNYLGCLIIEDSIKEDAASAVKAIKSRGLTTAMLTGDSEGRARAVADEAGIDEVHAKLLPQDKMERLADIRSRHGAVMFVGDGINDAPVLAAADVGAAMGSGADAAIEVADVVFMTPSLEAVPQALSIARSTYRLAIQNVVFALAVKAAVMGLGLLGFASMWMAVFADSGVSLLCVLNSMRLLYNTKHH